jgi:hypothetical protein
MVFDKKSIPGMSSGAVDSLTYRRLIRIVKRIIHLRISTRAVLAVVTLTKRVIKLVLPTLCSPRKTSLNFFNGLFEVEKSVPGAGL